MTSNFAVKHILFESVVAFKFIDGVQYYATLDDRIIERILDVKSAEWKTVATIQSLNSIVSSELDISMKDQDVKIRAQEWCTLKSYILKRNERSYKIINNQS